MLVLLISTWTYFGVLDQEANYYCESKQIKAYCFELSSTAKTCYTNPVESWATEGKGGKRCTDGWKIIPVVPESRESVGNIWGKQYKCDQVECVEIGS